MSPGGWIAIAAYVVLAVGLIEVAFALPARVPPHETGGPPVSDQTITRSALIEAASDAIRRASYIVDIPARLERDVMEVARTATSIHWDWRAPDNSCGCLIGTLKGPEYWNWVNGLTEAENEIGGEFVMPLGFGRILGDEPITVVEDLSDRRAGRGAAGTENKMAPGRSARPGAATHQG